MHDFVEHLCSRRLGRQEVHRQRHCLRRVRRVCPHRRTGTGLPHLGTGLPHLGTGLRLGIRRRADITVLLLGTARHRVTAHRPDMGTGLRRVTLTITDRPQVGTVGEWIACDLMRGTREHCAFKERQTLVLTGTCACRSTEGSDWHMRMRSEF